jgi:hypothetical protein
VNVGDRVAAARSLAAGRVAEGASGRVVRAGFFGLYDVDFGSGRIVRGVSRDALTADGGPWWARPRRPAAPRRRRTLRL